MCLGILMSHKYGIPSFANGYREIAIVFNTYFIQKPSFICKLANNLLQRASVRSDQGIELSAFTL